MWKIVFGVTTITTDYKEDNSKKAGRAWSSIKTIQLQFNRPITKSTFDIQVSVPHNHVKRQDAFHQILVHHVKNILAHLEVIKFPE